MYLTEQQKKMIDEVLKSESIILKCINILEGGSGRITIEISKKDIRKINVHLNCNEK